MVAKLAIHPPGNALTWARLLSEHDSPCRRLLLQGSRGLLHVLLRRLALKLTERRDALERWQRVA